MGRFAGQGIGDRREVIGIDGLAAVGEKRPRVAHAFSPSSGFSSSGRIHSLLLLLV